LGPIRQAIDAKTPQLRLADRVLLDEWSNVDFGWSLVGRFTGWELGRTAVKVVGGFRLLRGFAADGVALCSDENFVHLCDYSSKEVVNFGFLRLRDHGLVDETVDALRSILPPDVVPYSRAEVLRKESDHWVRQTSTGQ